ncbi:hypothetical protein NA57DRAFT_66687 [Rhizodiscina lignyota]|uniref:Zn(2)-C6 fungal-type domain-containing protein n=1 Tax=Rhizodiscina lignyota TaxID=1504668 RepID=A0A9P4IFV5_9PEZI|nr:hypothetical protein NA57DRAFT_66687 [Rhizodiscina lignyota]
MAQSAQTLARYSCLTCRKQKRKCDKGLPACSLCKKSGRICEYILDEAGRTRRETRPPAFPALFFLDAYTFGRRGLTVQIPEIELPLGVLDHIGNTAQVQHDADLYFTSIHTFFPIISRLRIYQHIQDPVESLKPDLVFLLYAMQLICRPVEDASGQVAERYASTKRLASHLESRHLLSVRFLQGLLLVGLYEMAHAIYPAGYLTVGHCARVAGAMGINNLKGVAQMFPSPRSVTELEEMRRVTWGIIILDRFVSIGATNCGYACEDARPDQLLPMDEKSWEKGEPAPIPSLAISCNTNIIASPFARTCQASDLLSRILRHVKDKHNDAQFYYEEAMLLHRTIEAFRAGISHELHNSTDRASEMSLLTGIAICYSAQIALYDMYTCTEADHTDSVGIPIQLEMQSIALAGMHDVCGEIHGLASKISRTIESDGLLKTSPFLCDCLYAAAINFIWYIQETGRSELSHVVVDLKAALAALGRRWTVANEYLKSLESEESRSP